MPSVTCSGCSKTIKAPDSYAGRTVACPGCGTALTFAAAAIPPAPPSSELRPDAPASDLFENCVEPAERPAAVHAAGPQAALPAQDDAPQPPAPVATARGADPRLLWIIAGGAAGIITLLIAIIVLLLPGKASPDGTPSSLPSHQEAAGAAASPAPPSPAQTPAAAPTNPAPQVGAATTPTASAATQPVQAAPMQSGLATRMLQIRSNQGSRVGPAAPGRLWVVLQLATPSDPPHTDARALRLRCEDGSEAAPALLGSINPRFPAPPPGLPPEAELRRMVFVPLAEADTGPANALAFDVPALGSAGKLSDGRTLTWTMPGSYPMAGNRPSRTPEPVPPATPITAERIALPGTLERPLAPLADGRQPLLMSAPAHAIVLFDAAKRSFGKPIPLPSAVSIVAAGGGKLVCHVPELGKFQVIDLDSGKEITSFPSPDGMRIRALGMARGTGDRFWAEVKTPDSRASGVIFATADGRVLERTEGLSGSDTLDPYALRLDENLDMAVLSADNSSASVLIRGDGGWQRTKGYLGNCSPVVPLADGSLLSVSGQIQPRDQQLPTISLNRTWLIPIPGVDAMLAIDPRNGALAVHQIGKDMPLLTIGGIPGWTASRPKIPPALPESIRVDLDRQLLVMIPTEDPAILVVPFDISERLRLAHTPHLLVRSAAVPTPVQGEVWNHRIQTITDQGAISFRLARGPDGMSVDANGTLTWSVPPQASAAERVCIELKGAGVTRLHEFLLLPARRNNGIITAIPRIAGMSNNCEYVDLGGSVVGACDAQDGRLVALSIDGRRAVVVVDIASGKEIAAIPWPGDKPPAYAAGGKLLVLASANGDALLVHDLASGRHLRRLEAPLPMPICSIAMGMSRDDVAICSARTDRSGAIDLIDLTNGRRRGVTFSREGRPVPPEEFTSRFTLRANADLSSFCAWREQTSPSGKYLFSSDGSGWSMVYAHESGTGSWLTADGRMVCDNAVLDRSLRPVQQLSRSQYDVALRPVHGSSLLLGICEDRIELFGPGGAEPLCSIARLPTGSASSQIDTMPRSSRASVCMALGKGYILAKGIPGIVIISALLPPGTAPILTTPSPTTYVPGKQLTVRLETLVPDPKMRFALADGPEGMRIEPDGTLRWLPAAGQGSSMEIKVKLTGQSGEGIAKLVIAPRSLELDDPTSWEGVGDRLRLGTGDHRLAADAGATYALLVNHGELWSLEAATLRPQAHLACDAEVLRMAVRGNEALVVAGGTLRVHELPSLKLLHSYTLPSREVYDLAVLPGKRLSFIACRDPGVADPLLCRRVVQVNEATGKVQWVDKVFGQMLAVAPDGRTLFTALQEYVRDTSTLVDQWGQRFLVTRTGNVSLLVRYSLNGTSGTAEQMHENPGGNLIALRMTGDSKYITPLSRDGYQLAGGNGFPIAMLSSSDIGRCELVLESSDPPSHLAYHPVLPLVLGGNGNRGDDLRIWITDYSKGKRRSGNITATAGLDAVEQALFSPDGTAAWLIGSSKGRRLLLAVPLEFADGEAGLVKGRKHPHIVDGTATDDRGGSAPAPDAATTAKPTLRINRSQLRALTEAGGQAKLDTKDLARRFQDAVVLILQDQGSGSGFLVSNDGLVATCAHILPPAGRTVRVQLQEPGRNQPVSMDAVVVARDERQDLALLKVDCRFATPYVRFERQQEPQMGEEVSVIGNPGMGAQVLTKTMTTGIISNPARTIEGQSFLQTSAAVNPGCSGGPLFNSRGNVIGMITLKARIEATAFAIPQRTVAAFLESCCAGANKTK